MRANDSGAPVLFVRPGDTPDIFLIMPVRMHDLEGDEDEDDE
jgi:hypothetical protein